LIISLFDLEMADTDRFSPAQIETYTASIAFQGPPFSFPILLLNAPTHQHNVLWWKNVDIQTELSYVLSVGKQSLTKENE